MLPKASHSCQYKGLSLVRIMTQGRDVSTVVTEFMENILFMTILSDSLVRFCNACRGHR